MDVKNLSKFLFVLILTLITYDGFGQGSVPVGINYQAVARDNSGKELISKNIDVKFSILSGNPLGTLVYQELHSNVITSKFGVFSLIIGKGVPIGGTVSSLSQVNWSQALHYLKVEVKFDNVFIEMGTMQFLSVPYALYAQKSLEPGPQGLKGDTGPQGLQGLQGNQGQKGDAGTQGVKGETGAQGPQGVQGPKGENGAQGPKGDTGAQGPQGVQGQKGDPGDQASDNQTLSFDGTNLSISVGNAGAVSTVNLTPLNVPHVLSINVDTLSITGGSKVTLPNQIQDLSLDINNILKVSKSSVPGIDLTRFLDDKQQLIFNNADSTLTITNGTTPPIDLSKYNQKLTFTPADFKLAISGGTSSVDLSPIKNSALQNLTLTGTDLSLTQSTAKIDMTPFINTDNQTLTYSEVDRTLQITNNSPIILGSIIAFRAGISASFNLDNNTPKDLIFDQVTGTGYYNEGGYYNPSTGTFKAPFDGIYSFYVTMNLPIGASSLTIKLTIPNTNFETVIGPTAGAGYFRGNLTMRLNKDEIVNVALNQGNGFAVNPFIISGTFSGYRVY
jgi:hypothetical protein